METFTTRVPDSRIRPLNRGSVRGDGRYVLYWMTAHRRSRFNFSLQRAVEWARDLGKPLLVFEPLHSPTPGPATAFIAS